METFIDLVNDDLKAMNPKHKQADNLSPKEKEALEILRNRTDIVITRAVVIMDIETYRREAENNLITPITIQSYHMTSHNCTKKK